VTGWLIVSPFWSAAILAALVFFSLAQRENKMKAAMLAALQTVSG
jgi:hypothetical protein